MQTKGTVLLAEDERTARLSLVELLEGHGYRVTQAEDGAAALTALNEKKFDVAVLDVRMPGLDGLTVLKRLRSAGNDLPVIVMTAHGDSATVIESMRLGAYDYVPKPVDFHHLAAQLDRAVSHHKMSQELRHHGEAEAPKPAIIGYSPAMQARI